MGSRGIELRQPIPEEDAERVINHVWFRTRDEAARFGVALWDVVEAGVGNPYHASLVVDGEPVVLMGARVADEGGDRVAYTWFIASLTFERHGRRVTRFLREYLRSQLEAGLDRIECQSAAEHPDAPRWFRLLGFAETDRSGDVITYTLE